MRHTSTCEGLNGADGIAVMPGEAVDCGCLEPRCDMARGCENEVTHLEARKGYIYCTFHAERRRSSGMRVRKIKASEMAQIRQRLEVAS